MAKALTKKDRQRNASASQTKNMAENLRNKVIRTCTNSLITELKLKLGW